MVLKDVKEACHDRTVAYLLSQQHMTGSVNRKLRGKSPSQSLVCTGRPLGGVSGSVNKQVARH